MQRWLVKFDDTPEMLDVRKAHKAAHVEYFQAHRKNILIGGGLRDDPGGDFIGGMWIVDAATRDDVVALVEADPYYHCKFRSYRVFALSKVIDEPITL